MMRFRTVLSILALVLAVTIALVRFTSHGNAADTVRRTSVHSFRAFSTTPLTTIEKRARPGADPVTGCPRARSATHPASHPCAFGG